MSVIIPYTVETSGEQCPICLEEFSIKEQRYSHEGGEQHGSHKQCLADWVINHPDCPVERTPLDATSILTMKDFALHRMEPAFYNATIATIIGLAATCTLGFGWAIAANLSGGSGLVAGASGILAGATIGISVGAQIFDTLEMNVSSKQNIAVGAAFGALSAPLCAAAMTPATALTETAVTAIVLICGLTASVLTLLRGY